MSWTMFLYIILIVSYHFLSIPSLITEVLQTKKSVSPNKSLWGLNLWCKDLVPQKKNEKDMQWVCWLFWPLGCLNLCAEQRVDFAQEMGDKELITHKGVSSTQQISSLVLICDAKTWSHWKRRKRICSECVDCFNHWTVFMCWTESGINCTEDGHLRADPISPKISLP